MFLFSSHVCVKRIVVDKAAVFVAVMLAPLVIASQAVQAAPVDKTENSVREAQTQKVATQADQVAGHQQQIFDFPNWPQRQQESKKIIPPPPPGPYMSSALSDYSVRARSFGGDPNKYEPRNAYHHQQQYLPAPMDMFSPDIPWPEDLRPGKQNSPDRWMPEKGYRYVPAQPVRKPFVAKPYALPSNNRYGSYNYGNSRGPHSDSMNINGSRWMPSMGMSPQGPYRASTNRRAYPAPYTGKNSANPYYPQAGKSR